MSLDEAFNWAIKMHPDELQGLTNGAVNPIGDLKTGAWQTVEKIKDDAKIFGSKTGSYIRDKALKTAMMKAIKSNPAMAFPLILRGSTNQLEDKPDSLGFEFFLP